MAPGSELVAPLDESPGRCQFTFHAGSRARPMAKSTTQGVNMSATSKPGIRLSVSGHPPCGTAIDGPPGDGGRDAPPFAAHARPRRRAGATSSVRFRRVGSGPPLLLIHPIGGDRRFWDVVLPRFTQLRDVVVPDLPGHGESPRLPSADPPTPKRLAASLAACSTSWASTVRTWVVARWARGSGSSSQRWDAPSPLLQCVPRD